MNGVQVKVTPEASNGGFGGYFAHQLSKGFANMENTQKYNGWTNYATWRVNLENFDGDAWSSFNLNQDAYDLGQELKDFVEDYIEQTSEGLARDYALAFLSDVNWYEIAEHMIEDYAEENEEA